MCHGFCEVPSLLPWCLVAENKSQMLGIYLHKHFKGIRSSFNNKGKKKNKACTMPEFIKSAYTFVMQVRILLEKYYGEC